VDQVVVDEPTDGLVPHNHARAESRCKGGDHERGGGPESEVVDPPPPVDRNDHGREPIALPRNGLDARALGAEGGSNLANGEIDAQVVFNDRIGPELCPDVLARHDLASAGDQELQQLEGLSLQRDSLAAAGDRSRLGVDDVLAEPEAAHEYPPIIASLCARY
jgi:hypothetical protein